MKLALDRYSDLDSPIHRWEQSSKLLALLVLIFAFAMVKKLILLPAMLIVTGILYTLSKLPFSFLLSRLRYPGWFILAAAILLPFVAGEEVIWSWGIFTLKQEGCLAVLLIVTRFICILTVSVVLFGTAPFLVSMKAMRALGLPGLMVDMMLLSYRYLEELGTMLTTMGRAMKLRGFYGKKLNSRNLKIIANLTGSLLVRSYEQSQRVYQAMLLRGYGKGKKGHLFRTGKENLDNFSKVALGVTWTIAAGFLLAEMV